MRRRVLHFVGRWLPASEGFVYDLVQALRRPGIVVSSHALENTDRFARRGVHSLEFLHRIPSAEWERRGITAALLAFSSLRDVGVLHVHHGYDAGYVVGAVRRRRMPLVLSLHGDDVTGLVAAKPDVYEPLVGDASAVIVPSRFLAGLAVEAGFDAGIVRVIPSGIDTSFFTPCPLPDAPTVLFVGRFVAKKGLDVLAEAWPVVARRVPGARLRVMGFGELEPLVRSIPGAVDVVLSPTRTEVRDAMREARCVVSPSHVASGDAVESLLVVNVEAQASGRPVVTTQHGGIPEHVHAGHSAILVPECDSAALADALVSVLTDDALARSMGAAGPPFVARYDLATTAGEVDALYDELCEAQS
ncbi:MAG: glycosyltransferase [Acidimicrobiales bacterium]